MKERQIYVVDSQILNTSEECARKAHLTFDKNLEPIVKPDYFEKGDMLHQMLAEYYKLRKYRGRWAQNNKTHADIIQTCIKVGRTAVLKMSLGLEVIEEVVRAFVEYTTYTANDGWDNILSVEETASKILYENDDMIILYQGKIDLILSISNCPLLPVDHKSSSRRQKPHYLSNQFQGYCWLLSSEEQSVNNIIINKIGFQKTLKDNEKFERHTLSYPPDILEEWKEISTYYLIKYIKDGELGFYPPNYTSCDKYSGCIFNDVCRKSKDVREYKLTQLFTEKQEVWDVGRQEK
jgi:hypothetical protein